MIRIAHRCFGGTRSRRAGPGHERYLSQRVRVRYAPSPTGELHLGGLRTALFNYIFAKQHGGDFILRIEDTDRTRYVEGSVERLVDLFEWCGLRPDEGPETLGGSCGPYVQSERLDLYRVHANGLIRSNKAYRCFCGNRESEDVLRSNPEGEDSNFDVPSNPNACRKCMNISSDESTHRAQRGDAHVVRLNVPDDDATMCFEDMLRGNVVVPNRAIDHQILLKSCGWPTYHLASVVDDHLMGITHVIRGDEWLSSTPKHALLYDAFGWNPPRFAHVPLLRNEDGSKISKRQAHAGVSKLRDRGVLPSALLNFVVLMGWSPSEKKIVESDDATVAHDQMLYMKDLVDLFSIERVKVSPAIVNAEKLERMNILHIVELCDAIVTNAASSALRAQLSGVVAPVFDGDPSLSLRDFDVEYVAAVISALKGRVGPAELLSSRARYFFQDPVLRSLRTDDAGDERSCASVPDRCLAKSDHQRDVGRRVWTRQAKSMLCESLEVFRRLSEDDFDFKAVKRVLRKVGKKHGVGMAAVMMPMRYAITGTSVGADMSRTVELLGRDTVVRRLENAISGHGHYEP